jgi:predicted amidophosphoribosyltransferase
VYEHVRVCRDCGEEYRPEIARCADCGGELEDVHPGAGEAASEPEPAPEAELAGHRVLFQTARARDLVPLAERLRARSIQYRLAEQPGGAEGTPARYALLVREEGTAGALAALADLIAPHEDAADVHAIETHFDAERGYLHCPACGATPAAGAHECPECGLALAGEPADGPHD